MKVLIAGCGYVGTALGAELAVKGHEVFGLRRSVDKDDELVCSGIKPIHADIRNPSQLKTLPRDFDWVVNTCAPSTSDAAHYKEVYLEGTRQLVTWLKDCPIRKYVYTSSTGVYGQDDASLIKEDSSTQSNSPTGTILVDTEQVILNAFKESMFPGVVLRVAGIYGPDRGYWFRQYLQNKAVMESKGDRYVNMIHRDDLVQIIIRALQSGRPGEVYNAVDDEPVTQLHMFHWLAETLGKPMPPCQTKAEAAGRQLTATNKRISNRKLKMELGYAFKYPTFRQGLTAEIQRLEQAGAVELA